jgi:tRNA G10  N-methylase Trm11
LIERALLGGVRRVIGTDLSAEALAISRRNFDAAHLSSVEAQFTEGDLREFTRIPNLGPDTITLILTNPPMGRRIAIPDLHGLIESLLSVAATALKPGGRLVFPNPVRIKALPAALQLKSTETVDLGGFDCQLEVYHKRLH